MKVLLGEEWVFGDVTWHHCFDLFMDHGHPFFYLHLILSFYLGDDLLEMRRPVTSLLLAFQPAARFEVT